MSYFVIARLLCWIWGHPGWHADTNVGPYACVRCGKEFDQ